MRLIDADELKKVIHCAYSDDLEILDKIDNAPTVEYTFDEAFQKTVCENRLYCPVRPTGEWIKETSGYYCYFRCNKCNSYCTAQKTNYCPNCGAKMKGAKNEISEKSL